MRTLPVPQDTYSWKQSWKLGPSLQSERGQLGDYFLHLSGKVESHKNEQLLILEDLLRNKKKTCMGSKAEELAKVPVGEEA